MPGTRKLGKATAHRMSMLKGMVTFLLEKGQIETTVTRAKEVSALTDKMITLGKKNTLASKRRAMSFLKKESVVSKLFTVISPLYDDRNGGYTRVLKIGPRRGDGAEMAVISMVDAASVYAPMDKKAKKSDAKAEKAKAEDTKAEESKTEEKKTSAKKAPKKITAKKATADKKAAPKKVAEKKTTKKAAPKKTAKSKEKKAEKTEEKSEGDAE